MCSKRSSASSRASLLAAPRPAIRATFSVPYEENELGEDRRKYKESTKIIQRQYEDKTKKIRKKYKDNRKLIQRKSKDNTDYRAAYECRRRDDEDNHEKERNTESRLGKLRVYL